MSTQSDPTVSNERAEVSAESSELLTELRNSQAAMCGGVQGETEEKSTAETAQKA
jgi:hypothetical protein